MTSPDIKPARRIEPEFDPKGVEFLREHGLKIIPAGQFKVLEEKPYITATDDHPFALKYDKYGSLSTTCIIDHTLQTPRTSMKLLMDVLASYADKIDIEAMFDQKAFQLDKGEPMPVKLNSRGWETVLRLVEHEFPGTIIWPQKAK